jgi:hypothetical protein
MSIESTLKSLRRELRDLDKQRAQLQSAIDALEPLSRNGTGSKDRKRPAKSSSMIDAAVAALRMATKPLPIMDLVALVQKSGVQANKPASKVRASLASALLRRDDVFSRPQRGIYGLVEWNEETK